MEDDELKNHVDSQRQEFEVYEFDHDTSWNAISEKLDDTEKTHVSVPVKYIWRVAAVLAISLGITFYMAWNNFSSNSIDMVTSIELAEADEYYGTLINTKVLQIRNSSSELDPSIFEDIEAMDKAFLELKEDLKDNADNEEVVSAMILNYKIKLEILEKILSEVEDENEYRNINRDEG